MCITAECPDPTEVGIWWRDDASWKLYSKDSMMAILLALLKGSTSLQLELSKSSAHPHGVSYLIDLSKMEQTNMASGHKRAIKLILPTSCYPTINISYRKEAEDAAMQLGAARFRLHNSCLLVIHRGDIVKWKVDGEVDAVVNPCSARKSSGLIDKRGSLLQKSTQTAGEMPTMASHMQNDSMFEKGRCIRSIQNSAKIVPIRDQSEYANGSIAAAVHRAAGPRLQVALQKSVHFADGKGRCGDAVVTPGFDLPSSHIVHTFAPPVYKKHDQESSFAKLERTYKSALSLAALNGIRYLAFPAISCGAGGFPLDLAARVALQAICNSDEKLEIHFVLLDQNAQLEWIAQASKSFSKA